MNVIILFVSTMIHTLMIRADDTLVVTEDNLDKLIEDHGSLLLIFEDNSPIKELKSLPKLFWKKKLGTKVGLVKKGEPVTREELIVKTFPTIRLLREGKIWEYYGLRLRNEIASWVERKEGPTRVTEKQQVEATLLQQPAIVIGFFNSIDSKEFQVFKQVAQLEEDISFYFVDHPDLMAQFHQGHGNILVLKGYEEKEEAFMDELTEENLCDFIHSVTVPLLIEFDQEAAGQIFMTHHRVVQHHFLFISRKNDEEHSERMKILKNVAHKHRHEITFVYVDWKEDNRYLLEHLFISEEILPTFCMYNLDEGARYRAPPGTDLSLQSINNFIKTYLAGKAKKSLLSEPIPKDDDEIVKTVVTGNYQEVVFQKEKDVFVVFYAPWCERSKNFSVIWDQLAQKFKDSEDKVFAKINVVGNEILGEEISSLPFIAWTVRNKKKLQYYRGPRDLATLERWARLAMTQEQEEEDKREKERERRKQETQVEPSAQRDDKKGVADQKIIRDEL